MLRWLGVQLYMIHVYIFYFLCLNDVASRKVKWTQYANKENIKTWKLFDETWNRTRVVAAKTKPK